MALDHSKLRQIKSRSGGAYVAQCPACADTGGDSQGEHLIIYPDGRFGCVAYPGESGKEHRTKIAKLTSTKGAGGDRQPKPAKLRQPTHEPVRTLMVLGRLGRQYTHSQGDNVATGAGDHKSPAPPEISHKDEVTRPRRPETEVEVEEHSEFLHE